MSVTGRRIDPQKAMERARKAWETTLDRKRAELATAQGRDRERIEREMAFMCGTRPG